MTTASDLETFCDLWSLRPDGAARQARRGVLQPVRTEDGAPATLRLGEPDADSDPAHVALRHWDGDGAARLLRADPRRGVLLLERLEDRDLTGLWDLEACEIVAGLYGRLHRPAGPQFRRLSEQADRWRRDLAALPATASIPHRLVEQVVALLRDFTVDDRTDGRLLHTDLRYETVLASDRQPWLAVEPRPLSGDPHYEVAPLLWHRWDELAGDVRGGVRRRFHAVVDAAGLDEDRARDWVVVRAVLRAVSPEPGPEWLTRCVSVAKAVQD